MTHIFTFNQRNLGRLLCMIRLQKGTFCRRINRIKIPAKYVDEPRYLLIGKIGEKCWSAIFTYRSNRIRIISVRRARKNEKEIYTS